QYDLAGRLLTQSIGTESLSYTYDAAGNLKTQQIHTIDANYNYDALHRLDDVDYPGLGSTIDYTYDANGNRIRAVFDQPVTFAYAPASNRMTQIDSTPVMLDASGNTLFAAGRTHAYNSQGRLTVTNNSVNGLTTVTSHDVWGRRIHKIVNDAQDPVSTTVFHYDLAGQLIAETDITGNAIRNYIWQGSEPIAQQTPDQSGLVYLHTDHVGTPRLATDTNGTIVWRWLSSPFGNLAPVADPDDNGQLTTVNLRLPGQYFDNETGLHYNYKRYYDPHTGRYLTSDPIGLDGGLNTYLYANANPVRYIDPMGESAVAGVLPFAGGAAAADGPLPIGDLIALGLLGGAAIYDMCTESDEEREERCEENLKRDLETCKALGKRGGKAAYRVCEQQAMLRYSNCLAGRDDGAPLPPWGDTY
ncbi:MAG: RHS repeat-associated core domain-containing protein, partial [Pseudomonadota bacterium]|nr:RHS repeat-associated core domain-containing protein [Pseudomonadota bacterium]